MIDLKTFYLSPSSINLFLKEPALWVLKTFYNIYGESNIYAVRGKLVEEVVNLLLDKPDLTLEDFYKIAPSKIFFDNVEVNKDNIKDFYNWGLLCKESFKDVDIKAKQIPVEGLLEDVKIRGYIDFENQEGEYIDLKTVSKLPKLLIRGERAGQLSTDKNDNIRQQIVYHLVSKRNTSLMFIDEQGERLHYKIQERDLVEHLPVIKETINNIKNLLTLSKEEVILKVGIKNINSFYWDNKTRAVAQKIWTGTTKNI